MLGQKRNEQPKLISKNKKESRSSSSSSDSSTGKCKAVVKKPQVNSKSLKKTYLPSSDSEVSVESKKPIKIISGTSKLKDTKDIQASLSTATNKEKSEIASLPKQLDFNQIHFKEVESYKIEDIVFLKLNYPNLFVKGTKIAFRIFEASLNYPKKSELIYGVISEFNEATKCFLVHSVFVETIENNIKFLKYLHEYYNTGAESTPQLINIPLKDIIELQIDSSKYLEKPNSKIILNDSLSSTEQTFLREIEFHFGEPYFSQNKFLHEKQDIEGCKQKSIL